MKNVIKSIGYIIVYVLFQMIVSMLFSVLAVLSGTNTENEIAEYIGIHKIDDRMLTIIFTYTTDDGLNAMLSMFSSYNG